jgi:AraC-like DNA-binding protein
VLPANEKLFFIKQALKDPSLITNELETWFKIPGAVLIRVGYGVTLLSMGLIHVHKWKRSFQEKKFQNQNQDVYRWLLFYTTILFSAYFFLFVEYIYHFFQFTKAYALFTLTVSVTIILICIYLLVRPNILYGASGWNPQIQPDALNALLKDQTLTESKSRYSISYEQGLVYKRTLEEHLSTHKPFQKQGYSIRDLSLELKIPTYQLSVFINQEYSKNFNELINEHRILFLKSLLDEEDKYKKYTLDALSKLGGFNSRSSFIAAVKRYAGQTPSEFFSRS